MLSIDLFNKNDNDRLIETGEDVRDWPNKSHSLQINEMLEENILVC